MMKRTWVWLGLFVAVIFLAGAGTGVVFNLVVGPSFGPGGRMPRAMPGPPPSLDSLVGLMTRDLDLSTDQQAALKALLEQHRDRLARVQQEFRQEAESLNTAIRGLLTPAQREKFDRLRRPGPPFGGPPKE